MTSADRTTAMGGSPPDRAGDPSGDGSVRSALVSLLGLRHARPLDADAPGSGRWRAFADAVAFALGINVWIQIVVLPGLFVGAFTTTAGATAAALPLVVLASAMWKRSETLLLFAFPSALMIPVALAPQIAGAHVYGPVRFTLVALGVIGYLLGVSFFSSFYEPPPPVKVRPLSSSRRPVPPRWRRRFRVYRALVALSVAFPLTLLYTINFDDDMTAFMQAMYPGRVAAMTAVLDLVAIGFWLAVYAYAFMGALRPHRTGDRQLVADLARLRLDARRGKPRPVFYVGVVCALGFMLLLMLSRYS